MGYELKRDLHIDRKQIKKTYRTVEYFHKNLIALENCDISEYRNTYTPYPPKLPNERKYAVVIVVIALIAAFVVRKSMMLFISFLAMSAIALIVYLAYIFKYLHKKRQYKEKAKQTDDWIRRKSESIAQQDNNKQKIIDAVEERIQKYADEWVMGSGNKPPLAENPHMIALIAELADHLVDHIGHLSRNADIKHIRLSVELYVGKDCVDLKADGQEMIASVSSRDPLHMIPVEFVDDEEKQSGMARALSACILKELAERFNWQDISGKPAHFYIDEWGDDGYARIRYEADNGFYAW